MLGKTAGGIFWMLRYMERSENTARMIDAGLRISLTRSSAADSEWSSILQATGVASQYFAQHDKIDGQKVINFLLREKGNDGSVMANVELARTNARMVRTALTKEVWEAVNECWMVLKSQLAKPVKQQDLPEILTSIRQRTAFVRGSLHGTMVRNDIYDFARMGTFFERADNAARVLDVKYYILLPSIMHVGTVSDNVQWETILRATSSVRAYQSLHDGEYDPRKIARFLILDKRLPRSLAFCYHKIQANLAYLAEDYGERKESHKMVDQICHKFDQATIDKIFEYGLHEFVTEFLAESHALGRQIERDYRFYE
ncbi:alpha-E domain-containing protein [Marinibacterium sp. SX1]|uniref:alpha-E domain-containing protein n=1 Tax=Marinibacterium sp. SX1 TaxID=3388424 RepID=UPI003D18631A